jgi:predicted RNase H-like HicB family nuclease
MKFLVEIEKEEDGRWIAEVPELPGVMAYGQTSAEATGKAQALALRVIAERIEHGEEGPELLNIIFYGRMSNWPSSKARRVLSALL